MAVNSVNSGYTHGRPAAPAKKTDKATAAASETAATTDVAEKTDTFDSTSKADAGTYSKNTAGNKIKGLSMAENPSALAIKNELMRGYVENTLKGEKYTPGSALGLSALNAAEATSNGLSAEEYWGSEATAERIFTFGKTLAGGNLDTLDKMEKAFLKGYNSAVGQITKSVGKAKVPTVTGETYDKVMNKFAAYRKELQEKAGLPDVPTDPVNDPGNVAAGGTVNGVEKPKYEWQTDEWRKDKTGKTDYSYPLPDETPATASEEE